MDFDGTGEISKLIEIIKDNLISLFQINIGKVKEESKDLDFDEKIKLVMALGYSLLEILQAINSPKVGFSEFDLAQYVEKKNEDPFV